MSVLWSILCSAGGGLLKALAWTAKLVFGSDRPSTTTVEHPAPQVDVRPSDEQVWKDLGLNDKEKDDGKHP